MESFRHLFVFAFGLLALNSVSAKLKDGGDHVCSYTVTRYVQRNVSTTAYVPKTTVVYTTCGWGSYCYRTMTKYVPITVYRMTTKTVTRNKYYCCSGWQQESPEDRECKKPICNVQCQNGGTCSSPNVCTCARGFEGLYCQNDVNECSDPTLNNCGQSCINEFGSFRCGCKRGFKLNPDGKKCEDIDECSQGVCTCAKDTKKCKASCQNTDGSYSCGCPQGYEQRIPGVCQDRNECIENSDICDQTCVNVEGGYNCSCFRGYAFNKTSGKCEDIDECLYNKGGCSHVCHNIVAGRVCSCPSGFYLGPDKTTCKEIKASEKEIYMCEGDFKTLQCVPKKLGILYAMYGRLSKEHCQTGNYTTTNLCQFDGVQRYVQNRCDNKILCGLWSSTKVFEIGSKDPCPDASKYLHVIYTCV